METTFSINDKPYTVNLAELPADITLNTFIREHAGLSGTKFMCQEGGCGVCICTVTDKHSVNGEVRIWAVNSCLTLLNSCVNWEITTIEGIGSKRHGFHSIQKRLAKMNGTQCGYCSPGFVMNMYALLKSRGNKLTMKEVENSFGGNLCRCTGYRPILDAMKSFAGDSTIKVPAECRDIEDLSTITGNPCGGSCTSNANMTTLSFNDGSEWYWPKSMADLFRVLAKLQLEKYMLVAGNTAHGVYRRAHDIKIFIDVNGVPELHSHTIGTQTMVLGANLSLTEAMDIFQQAAKKPGFEYCQQLWDHFDLIANVPVRNMGTLAGNLSLKHQHKEFPSDVFIVFEALNVRVIINESAYKQEILSLADYLQTPMTRKVITSFMFQALPCKEFIFDSYKIMPRAQNAHAYVNAAFLVNVENEKVLSARLCFGGINPDFVHATTAEKTMTGRMFLRNHRAGRVVSALQNDLKVDAILPDASPEYRQKLACGLFYKFLLKSSPLNSIEKTLMSGGELLKRPLSSGKQIYKTIAQTYPINKPTEKHEGLIQCSGEATFANDVPAQKNQVWAALITAKKVGATVTKIDATQAMKLPGVVAFFTASDIPGKNAFSGTDPLFFVVPEQLFVTGPIKHYNQPVGVIVAESNALANRAAELVQVSYSGGAVEVLPNIRSVLNNACADRVQNTIISIIEDVEKLESHDLHVTGKLDMGLQSHFFMEPQTTVVVPTDGCLEIYVASQWMDLVQEAISKLLKLKYHEIQVKVRRIGGGYGGKGTRCNLAACAAALAAYKLHRPVRLVQSLESMMDTLGKRWPCYNEYEFYVKRDGKIIQLQSTFYEDAGCTPNETPMNHTVLLSKNCYEFCANFKLSGKLVVTDSPSNTAARAPGSLEAIAMIENIIEHIAFVTRQDPVEVRYMNMLPFHKMRELLPRFTNSIEYNERKRTILNFNGQNRWHKKGLGIAIMEFHMGYFGQYMATVAVYHGDGSVIISHGGIEMGQGMNTKVAQVAAYTLGIPVELIRFEPSNTVNGANSMVTGGSVGSESICYAVRKCCNTLLERLEPIKHELRNPTWRNVVTQAFNRDISLIASDDCKPNDMDPYTVCALGATEVHVDILTGNYLVTRVDILEDAGESLNPSVDIGQIEGAFMMGLGYWTTEQCVVDPKTGELLTNRTWNYNPPGAKDIPIDFRIELLPGNPNPAGFMRSKATGEPAICLAVSVTFALQEALQSARDYAGLKRSWVSISAPMTPEHILLNSGTDYTMMELY